MKSRAELINAGKIYQVYSDENPDNIYFEGNKTACLKYIKETFGMKMWRKGRVRIGKIIWENGPKEYIDKTEKIS